MPVKKRKSKARAYAITPAAVEAFKLCEAISAAGEEKSRADEYREAAEALFWALNLRPWLENPLDVHRAEPPDWMQDQSRIASWREAWAMRRDILAAMRRGTT
jgi:hypothetical protein